MSKILELFKMHNIKYVCSVDDCYAAPDINQIKAMIYTEMTEDFTKYKAIFSSEKYIDLYEETASMLQLGVSIEGVVNNFIEKLPKEKLIECYSLNVAGYTMISKEKEDMNNFLLGLKEQNIIDDYKLVSSTAEAAHLDLTLVTNGAVLWLVDKDFSKVNESENAGLEFAKILVERDESKNYIYIVSAISTQEGETEDEVEKEFDDILNTSCDLNEKRSFCYFIHKGKIQTYNNDKIASSLAQGFRRKANFLIINDIRSYMEQGLDNAWEKCKKIDQRTLNYVISEKVIKNGESCFDFVIRMMRLLYEEETRKCISTNFDSMVNKMSQYEIIYNNDIKLCADEKKATDILKTYREIELYDYEINHQHKEIGFGDIFKINNDIFLLISQPCDCTIRINGRRELDNGIMLKIEENKQGIGGSQLPCLVGFSKPSINLRSYISLPFDLLDLCVFDNEGQAVLKREYISIEQTQLPNYLSSNFINRFEYIVSILKPVLEQKMTILSLSDQSSATDIQNQYNEYIKFNPYYHECQLIEDTFVYPIKRICRMDELHALSIAQKFTNVFARVGLPFDFIKE